MLNKVKEYWKDMTSPTGLKTHYRQNNLKILSVKKIRNINPNIIRLLSEKNAEPTAMTQIQTTLLMVMKTLTMDFIRIKPSKVIEKACMMGVIKDSNRKPEFGPAART